MAPQTCGNEFIKLWVSEGRKWQQSLRFNSNQAYLLHTHFRTGGPLSSIRRQNPEALLGTKKEAPSGPTFEWSRWLKVAKGGLNVAQSGLRWIKVA